MPGYGFTDLLQTTITLLTIIGLLVSVAFYFRGAYAKQSNQLLRNDRDDANARAEGLKEDLTRLNERFDTETTKYQADVMKYETLLSEKSQEVHTLRNIVTGKDQLDRIEKLLTTIIERKFNDTSS